MDKNQNQLNAEADVVKTTNTSLAAQILNNIKYGITISINYR